MRQLGGQQAKLELLADLKEFLGALLGGVTHWGGRKRLLRRVARHAVEETRESITRLLRARGHEVEVFNGGGSGSVEWTAAEAAITEVTAGS